MSTELKTILLRVVAKECKREEAKIEEQLPQYTALLKKIEQLGKLDLALTVQGTVQADAEKDAALLAKLVKADLVKGEDKFTHRNNYRQYALTPKGEELLRLISPKP